MDDLPKIVLALREDEALGTKMNRKNDYSPFDEIPKLLRDLYREALNERSDGDKNDYQTAMQRFAEAFESDLQRHGIPLPENTIGKVMAVDEKSGKPLSS